LIFYDEFDGDSLNKENWIEPWIRCAFDGAKLEYNSFDNISVSNGFCRIVAKSEHVTKRVMDDQSISDQQILSDGKPNFREFDYTSGTLVSTKKLLYGRYEARIRMPDGAGLWPAFWTFGGKRWNEIDFLDGYTGITGYSVGAIYDENGNGCYAHEGESCGDFVSGISPDLTNWHTISCVFNKYSITWLLDDRVVHTQLRFQTLSGNYISCGDDIEKGSQFLMRKNIPLEAMNLYQPNSFSCKF
jgi:beta-glucanase (GH16 family)